MKRLSVGVVVALAVMALTAVIAANAGTTQADQDLQVAQAEVQPKLGDGRGAAGSGQESGFKRNAAPEDKAFIGITLSELPEAEAEALQIAGGAVVTRVLDDGPAAGLLARGDVIVSVGGVDVSTAADVVQAVQAVAPGDTLSFTIMRDGGTLTVEVEAGHRPFKVARRAGPNTGPNNPVLGLLRQLGDRLAKAEIVLETDDGFKTFRAVAGTLRSDLDVNGDTFALIPADGSDAITYVISADTVVQTTQRGTLAGLNTTDRTLVVDVDGDVKLVHQGNVGAGKHMRGRPFGGRGHDFRRGPGGFPDIQRRLGRILPRLEGAGFDLRTFLDRSSGAFGERAESLNDTLRDIIGSREGFTQ